MKTPELESRFVKTYSDQIYRHSTLVRHNGKVIAFAMGGDRRLYYAVLDLDGGSRDGIDARNWPESPRELPFPQEIAQLGFAVLGNKPLLLVRRGGQPVEDLSSVRPDEIDPFLSSTARLTADVSFQALSDEKHVFLFRQSISADHPDMVFVETSDGRVPVVDSTLLVDRYVLVGTELRPTREVRFRRSRNKSRPQNARDTLGASDMNDQPFFEPTLELDFVRNLSGGRFSVVMLPTETADARRWQIFAHNGVSGRIDSYNIARASDGLFDLRGSPVLPTVVDPDAEEDRLQPDPMGLGNPAGFAESALHLDAETVVEIDPTAGSVLRMIAAWLKPESPGALFSEGTPDEGFVVAVEKDGALALSSARGTETRVSFVSPPGRVRFGEWNAIAVVLADEGLRLHVNGNTDTSDPLERPDAQDGRIIVLGGDVTGSSAGLAGAVDELRLWNRPVDAYEASAGLLQRLVGDEPGLAVYLRFDEGSGAIAYDQTDHLRHGRIVGTPSWTLSDAPVADQRGIRRTSFAFEDRTIATGLSALLYFQQEEAAVGHGAVAGPVKRNARVMLAVGTGSGTNTGGPNRNHVAVLDFALARNGRLAQVPDVIGLPALGHTQLGLPPLNQQIEQIEAVEQGITNLEVERRGLQAQLQALDAEVVAKTAERATLAANRPISVYGSGRQWQNRLNALATEIKALEAKRFAPLARIGEIDQALTIKRMELKDLRARLMGDRALPMPTLHMDPQGLTLAGGLLEFAWTDDSPFLFDSTTGKLALYFRGVGDQFFVTYVDTNVARAGLALTGGVSLTARTADDMFGRTLVTVEPDDAENAATCTVTLRNPDLSVTEVWRQVPRDNKTFAAVINGRADYDYRSLSQSSRAVYALENGSLLVTAVAAPEPGDVEDTRTEGAPLDGPGLSTRWVVSPPGNSLVFSGSLQLVPRTADQRLAAAGDLTLEAWARPENVNRPASVVEQAADGSRYILGIKPGSGDGALAFDGTDSIEVEGVDLADRSFTVEFWARRDSPGRLDLAFYQGQVSTGTLVHAGFRENDRFTFAFYKDDLNTDPYPDTDWHHWACVFHAESRLQQVYRDGVLVKERTSNNVYGNRGPFFLGRGPGSFVYRGALDEVRIWKRARSAAEIVANWRQRLEGFHPDLLAYWSFEGGDVRDRSHHRLNSIVHGNPRPAPSWLPHYTVIAGAGSTFAQSKKAIPCRSWTHFSAAYDQSYALAFDGRDDYLACGGADGLNLGQDLTIEATVRVDDVSRSQGILSKGAQNGGDPEQGVPYALYSTPGGGLVFAFEDTNGAPQSIATHNGLVSGQVHRLAVTREKRTTTPTDINTPVQEWLDLRIFVDGVERAASPIPAVTPAANRSALDVGRAWPGGTAAHLGGSVSEVRIWNEALAEGELGRAPARGRQGLVAWWRLEEGEGGTVADPVGGDGAAIEGARWIKDPDPEGSRLVVRENGVPLETEAIAAPAIESGFQLGRDYEGELDEVRIWRTARTEENILDNMFGHLRGERRDLIAYYPFDRDNGASDQVVLDNGIGGNHLTAVGANAALEYNFSSAPLCDDFAKLRNALAGGRNGWQARIQSSPAVTEYGDLQYNALGELSGTQKRCYGYVKDGDWQLVTGFKVGEIVTEWIGQVQFDPQVMAYVEGAPPVPSENLTGEDGDDFAGASSLEVVEAKAVSYAIGASREGSFDTSLAFSASIGVDFSSDLVVAPLGFGCIVKATNVQIGASTGGSFESSQGWSSSESRGHGRNRTRSTSVALAGYLGEIEQPDPAQPPRRRYQLANVGFALVESSTADVFALRLAHNRALVAYRFRPNPDIPRDVNVITFPIKPQYTKQGTLDGAIGFGSQGKILDPAYPNASGPGQHSYFKPREAYALRERIRCEEQQLKAYYDNFAPVMTMGSAAQAGGSVLDEAAGSGTARRIADTLNVPMPSATSSTATSGPRTAGSSRNRRKPPACDRTPSAAPTAAPTPQASA